MTSFKVSWEIDIEAETPLEAAQQAWDIVRRPSSSANVFTVYAENGETEKIDLQEHFESA